MSKFLSILSILVLSTLVAQSQDSTAMSEKLPYYEIPEAAEAFTAGAMTSRMVEGLGFRYHWATESLRQEDLDYKASESGRTVLETMDHIHGLSQVFLNAVTSTANGNNPEVEKTYDAIRQNTLKNLEKASTILRASDEEAISNMKIIFVRGEKTSEYPFWNALNGPLEDAVWHVGQIVMLRRAAGNPWNSKASVFSGKIRS